MLQDGNIAVSDYDNKWISVYQPSGKFVSKLGGSRLLGPKGLTVAQTGELIVVDNKANITWYLTSVHMRSLHLNQKKGYPYGQRVVTIKELNYSKIRFLHSTPHIC